MASITKAISNYAKSVAGGAGIVASAVSSAAKSITGKSQSGAVLNAVVPKGTSIAPKTSVSQPRFTVPGQNATYTAAGLKTLGLTPTSKNVGNGVQLFNVSNTTPPQNESGYNIIGSYGAIGGGAGGGGGTTSRSLSSSNLSSSGFSSSDTALSAGQFGGDTQFSSFASPSSNLASGNTSTPTSNVINAPNVLNTGNTKLTIPTQKIKDYSMDVPSITEETPDQKRAKSEEESRKTQEDYIANLTKDFNNIETGASIEARLQKELDIKNKEQLVNDLTGQLTGVVNKGEALKLSLVGQGRGIPEAILGGQQAEISRQTAIQALPIQAQLQAAQGNLEMANDNLDRLFKIYSEDAKNKFDFQREIRKTVYEGATAAEKRKLDRLDKLDERAYQETQELHKEQNVYAKMAFETGQASLGAKIAQLDYKSPTFKSNLAALSGQIVDTKRQLEIKKLQSDLANAGTTVNPKVLATTQFKAAQAAQNLKLTLDKAKAAVEKYGNYERASGVGKGILNTLKVQLRSEISTALEQGVVVPGEAESFDKIAGQLNSSFWGVPNVRNSVTVAALNSLSESMKGRIDLQKAALTNTYKVSPEQIDTLLNITDLSDQEFADMDALIE